MILCDKTTRSGIYDNYSQLRQKGFPFSFPISRNLNLSLYRFDGGTILQTGRLSVRVIIIPKVVVEEEPPMFLNEPFILPPYA